ncbi:hypothetical protein EYF80_044732 [Liparis tanakae]|uniref:Uncharacterized protein n=1 Tax=Liparis tanakae TaxID=230148 RepID=A0A4Z2FVR0_9TELE|nr:hypothetical protein EYF80_044732 [Liparis tanakae]
MSICRAPRAPAPRHTVYTLLPPDPFPSVRLIGGRAAAVGSSTSCVSSRLTAMNPSLYLSLRSGTGVERRAVTVDSLSASRGRSPADIYAHLTPRKEARRGNERLCTGRHRKRSVFNVLDNIGWRRPVDLYTSFSVTIEITPS